MSTNLNKTETTILRVAADRPDGLIVLPDSMKPASRERLLGRLVRDELASPRGEEHLLTKSGYRAVGQQPPVGNARTGTKKMLIGELLARDDGATLAELIEATGWLPHTTRAALSRIRSAGQVLEKRARPDGKTAYRLETSTAAPASRSRRKTKSLQAAA